MTPEALVANLEARGGRLTERKGALVVTPRSILQDADREGLRVNKADVLGYLRGRALGVDWSRVSLYQLHKVLEVAVPWSDVPLILAPGCRIARELRSRDPKPGRVWCTCEVLDLLLVGVKPEDARATAQASMLFDGTVAGIHQERHR